MPPPCVLYIYCVVSFYCLPKVLTVVERVIELAKGPNHTRYDIRLPSKVLGLAKEHWVNRRS